MLGISTLGATPTAILYIVGVVLFVLAGLGQAVFGEKISLVGLGLAAVFAVFAWNALAAT
jgi:hypothetical protein